MMRMRWIHHQFNEHELEQSLGDSEGHGSLECCSPWGCKESDRTSRLNNELIVICYSCNKNIKYAPCLDPRFDP